MDIYVSSQVTHTLQILLMPSSVCYMNSLRHVYLLHTTPKHDSIRSVRPRRNPLFITFPWMHTTYVLTAYIAHSLLCGHTSAHPWAGRTRCPHLSSPSLLSAQPNSIRHSSHCRHGAHSVSRHAHQNIITG